MSYELSFDASRMDIDVVHGYLRKSYWSQDIRRDVVEAAIRGSIVLGAFDLRSGVQVAFARAVTDRATFAWLCDVFVLEEHRGAGLSKRMVEAMLAHPDLTTLRRWCLATRDAHTLYTRFDFVPVPEGRWLERKSPVAAWTEP